MNPFKSLMVVNVSLVLLTGFALYITSSLWSLLILFFMLKLQGEDDLNENE